MMIDVQYLYGKRDGELTEYLRQAGIIDLAQLPELRRSERLGVLMFRT